MIMYNKLSWLVLTALISSSCLAFEQADVAQQVAPPNAPSEVEHALKHINDLQVIAREATPTAKARSQLNKKITASIKRASDLLAKDPSSSEQTKSAAQQLRKSKDLADVASVVRQNPGLVNTRAIEDLTMQTEQVVVTNVPAYSVMAAPPNGVSGITRCQSLGPTGGYPTLNGIIQTNLLGFRALADSVGRIEVKSASSQNSYDLVGTGFVIDQQKGLVATACHVVGDLADAKQGGGWTIPADKWGNGATVFIDFGETEAHDSTREFQVTGVAFLPNLQGCDGALLQVDTKSGALPSAIAVAANDPTVSNISPLNVISIGYPSRNLIASSAGQVGNVTQLTYDYFSCLRSSQPAAAKFLFGGKVTGDESQAQYHILPHIVPTAPGQSGSPIIDITDPGHPQVIGVHVCCVIAAQVSEGNKCEWRSETYLQEAISAADLLKLYKASQPLAHVQMNEIGSDSFGIQLEPRHDVNFSQSIASGVSPNRRATPSMFEVLK